MNFTRWLLSLRSLPSSVCKGYVTGLLALPACFNLCFNHKCLLPKGISAARTCSVNLRNTKLQWSFVLFIFFHVNVNVLFIGIILYPLFWGLQKCLFKRKLKWVYGFTFPLQNKHLLLWWPLMPRAALRRRTCSKLKHILLFQTGCGPLLTPTWFAPCPPLRKLVLLHVFFWNDDCSHLWRPIDK